ncbi:ATP-binding protein [Polluticoccus soli]|uniref:DNA polymerase III subunit n=1 Tax=Polluticoccus soli TaxID=3034150 RepID=UPI0023E27E10|nr:DNA polymerase III subunit delta' [Flavipsychrobacter sp. JY13-12]
MQLSNVVGQQPAKTGLLKMWQGEHFPHALLLVGQEGTGGLPLGLALAQYIFCENKQDNDSCGQCPNCSKVSKLEHADLRVSFPSIPPKPNTKAMSRHYIQDFREFIAQTPYATTYDWLQFINAENKQGNITAEECREMIEQLNLKSYEGGKKVQIIWRPEYLGKEGNILLKLIEEPPADTIMIFIAENTEDILPTILSRTQMVRLAPISASEIADALVQRGLADAKKAAQVGHMANGSFTEALRLVRHAENDLFPDVRTWFNAIFRNNGLEIAKFSEEWSKSGREQQKNFLHYIIQLLEQTIRVRYLPQHPPALPDEEAQFVQKLAAMPIPLEVFGQMVKEITDTIYFIERNAHSKTQLHALSVRMVYAIQKRQLPIL